MSITVSDILRLPSMRGARLLGGRGSLGRTVSSISVLEYANPNILQDALFNNNEFYGSEIVITGFMNNPDDVELQCANIRRLSEVGEVGLILYYVGIFMPRVDPKLVELADALDFALICMPEKRMDRRYSEVICEVMEAIYRDRLGSRNVVGEILEDVSNLPGHQRTVDTVLKMLSDRMHASFLLMDASQRILNEATWPRALSAALIKAPPNPAPCPCGSWTSPPELAPMQLYRSCIRTQDNCAMDLLILKEGTLPDPAALQQSVEVVQLAVNIWSGHHDQVAVGELVRAILQDEPLKMRRLADIFHIDVVSINSMWIVSGAGADDRQKLHGIVRDVRDRAAAVSVETVADIYEEELVLFMAGPSSMQDIEILTQDLLQLFRDRGIRAALTRAHALGNTRRVREAFLNNRAGLSAAQCIFKTRSVFNIEQVVFALNCREDIQRGERAVRQAQQCLDALHTQRESASLISTLECFMLDADMSIARTAELMFVHKNTIKYRIQQIGNRLGFPVGHFPESLPVYTACGVNRLLAQQS